METKRVVIGTALALALFAGWFFFITWANKKFGPPVDQAAQTAGNPAAPAGGSSTQPGTGALPTTAASSPTTRTAAASPGAAAAPGAAASQPATTGLQVLTTGEGKSVDLGSAEHADPQFALRLRTTAAGAGIESVVLNSFYRAVDDPSKEPYSFQQQTDENTLAQYGHALATRSITVDGQTVDVSKVSWTLESQDAMSATYSVTLGRAGDPAIKVLKTYRIYPRTEPNAGYEVAVSYAIENHSAKPANVSIAYTGPAMPPRELDSGPDQRVIVGYNNGGGIKVVNEYSNSFVKDTVTRELSVNDDKLPMLWAGTSTVYFQAIVMPPVRHAGGTVASTTKSFKGIGMDPEAQHKELQPVATAGETVDLPVGPNQRVTYPLSVYFGPKDRRVLDQPYYAALPRHYDQTLVVRVGPCAFCAFDPVINVLVWLLGVFHWVWGGFVHKGDWGLAIISLVLLVRLTLHPVTKRSQISMLKMGKMGPEMERLKKKYADNKPELQKAMWEFQKQQGITPILGCLPMFLQMPIWIALWSALNTTFELRHASFLWGWTWIHDLAKPDRLIRFPGAGFTIPLLGTHVDGLNLLPIILAGVFYLQQKFTPKPPTMTPEQAQQQKIMQGMMVFLFPLFLYAQPSGLNLYIMTSTAIGIWESKRIRQHIKEKEEAEKAGIVIVDADPPSGGGGKRRKDEPPHGGGGGGGGARVRGIGSPKQPLPASGNWLSRKLAELQEKAEQARGQNERRGRDRA
jgi:YidC/Oxa1 family membrane protein insertase